MTVLKYRDPGTGTWHTLRSSPGERGPAGVDGQPGRDGVTITQAEADGRWLPLDGSGQMYGPLDVAGNGIVDTSEGVSATDAATKMNLDEQPPLYPVRVSDANFPPRGPGDLWVETNQPVLEWDTDWKYPTLLNGWENYGEGHTLTRYRLFPGGLVRVEGVVKHANSPHPSVLFHLDPGYYSTGSDHRLLFLNVAAGNLCRIDINQHEVRLEVFLPGGVSGVGLSLEFCVF